VGERALGLLVTGGGECADMVSRMGLRDGVLCQLVLVVAEF
jgi:hypothetical protein